MFSDDRLISLPISIHARIFNLFTLQHRLECITVCKAWRSMILGCPGIWKILSTSNGRYIVPELLPYLPYINAKDVKQLQYRSQGDIHNYVTLSMAEASRDTEMLSTMADFVSYKQCDVIEQGKRNTTLWYWPKRKLISWLLHSHDPQGDLFKADKRLR